eukprot:TRINITY_DN16705_c0_g1_i1.p1 TRINITY_DN16705_c0_g1~~TRINITY_DN16705_c0_g1_i1.p1  ORF type:complete len:1031 (-),score=135.69 TRINITY_DN16705_c0_g1_i1:203-2962(-)
MDGIDELMRALLEDDSPDIDSLPDYIKDVYKEHPDVTMMTPQEVDQLRIDEKITILQSEGRDVPKPVTEFLHGSFNVAITNTMQMNGFVKPRPIQMQGWPVAMSGRDMVGIAQTGAGKTLAYVLPAMAHIVVQKECNKPSKDPIAMIICPTRELANQVHEECVKYAVDSIKPLLCMGREGSANDILKVPRVQLVVGTCGRLMHMIKSRLMGLSRLSYVVMDEADHLLDKNTVRNIEAILQRCRKDRQTLMWSATWDEKSGQAAIIKEAARKFCKEEPVIVRCGGVGGLTACCDITQQILLCTNRGKEQLFQGVMQYIWTSTDDPHVLVIAQTKTSSDNLAMRIKESGLEAAVIHGGCEQEVRNSVMLQFEFKRIRCLAGTGVVGRGLDIPTITHVIIYDFPSDLQDYVHRIGRTARAGRKGNSFAFLSDGDVKRYGQEFVENLVTLLEESKQTVPTELKDPALSSSDFRNYRYPLFSARRDFIFSHKTMGIDTQQTTDKCHVSKDEIGRLIGAGGSTINQIRSVTGCELNADGENELMNITGPGNGVAMCKAIVRRILKGGRYDWAVLRDSNECFNGAASARGRAATTADSSRSRGRDNRPALYDDWEDDHQPSAAARRSDKDSCDGGSSNFRVGAATSVDPNVMTFLIEPNTKQLYIGTKMASKHLVEAEHDVSLMIEDNRVLIHGEQENQAKAYLMLCRIKKGEDVRETVQPQPTIVPNTSAAAAAAAEGYQQRYRHQPQQNSQQQGFSSHERHTDTYNGGGNRGNSEGPGADYEDPYIDRRRENNAGGGAFSNHLPPHIRAGGGGAAGYPSRYTRDQYPDDIDQQRFRPGNNRNPGDNRHLGDNRHTIGEQNSNSMYTEPVKRIPGNSNNNHATSSNYTNHNDMSGRYPFRQQAEYEETTTYRRQTGDSKNNSSYR